MAEAVRVAFPNADSLVCGATHKEICHRRQAEDSKTVSSQHGNVLHVLPSAFVVHFPHRNALVARPRVACGALWGESERIYGLVLGGLQDRDSGMANEMRFAHEVRFAPLPHFHCAVCGAAVEKPPRLVRCQRIDGVDVCTDRFNAFQVGETPHFDGLVPRAGVEDTLP